MVTIQAKVPYMCGWEEVQNRIDHAQSSTQNGKQTNMGCDMLAFHYCKRCFNINGFKLQV